MHPFDRLVKIMEELREKCPWDRKQTHESLKKYLLEETYEVMDAIDSGDSQRLKEELGDLLLQPLFHSQIAKERGEFDIYEVIRLLTEKLIERHPHVFGNADAEEVLKNWDKNKLEGKETIFEGIPKHMPALLRSQKLQDRASKVGFDFENIDQVFEKLTEEIEELKDAINRGDSRNVEHEIGDILTAVVELARFLGVNAEIALQKANDRFIKRFSYIEKKAKEKGISLEDMSLEEMDKLWMEAKSNEGSN